MKRAVDWERNKSLSPTSKKGTTLLDEKQTDWMMNESSEIAEKGLISRSLVVMAARSSAIFAELQSLNIFIS